MDTKSLAQANSHSSLQNALADFQLVLDSDQQSTLSSIKSVPDADSILIFTAQLDLANRNRKGRSIGSRLYTVLSSVRNFCTVVDVFVSSHPEVAALVWGSVRMTMQIAAIIRCCKQVIKATQQPWINQTLSAMLGYFDEEFKSDMEDVKKCSNHVSEAIKIAKAQVDAKEHALQARERYEASQSRNIVSHLFKRTNDHQNEARAWQLENEVRRKCKPSRTTLNIIGLPLKQNQRKRYRDTANWIFRESGFNNWANGPDTTLLWCSGKIGSGKTITAASVIDHLLVTKSNPGAIVSFFFVRSDNQESLKAETIMMSILRQRLPSASELSDKMEDRIKDIASSGDFDSIVTLLGDITSGLSKFYIVIDGLDECDKPERTVLLEALSSLSVLCMNLKLLPVSRDSLSEEICRHFPVLQRISTGGVGTNNDIAAYVEGIVHEKLDNGDLRIGDTSILEEIKKALIEGADGMFLWVFFQVQEICLQHCDEDVRKAIENLPRGLPETFCRALRRINTENNARAASRVFLWTAVAIRPLSIYELREALAVEVGQRYSIPERFFNDMDRVSSWCQNLVQVDEEDHTVQFMHQTVRQFLLEDPIESNVARFHFDLDYVDHTIGEICVTYLNFSDFKRTLAHTRRPILLPSPSKITANAYGRRSVQAIALRMKSNSGPTTEYFDIEPTINTIAGLSSKGATPTQGHPFLEYASTNWFLHTKHFEETKSRTWRI
ncbi:hypothetical protein GGS24DRAFT_495258 [Hypoxylon argillaceum]|nr:hypothetical protein GGS24DRAFT_495258 [Hypoxylon argillaceum]